MEKLKQCYDKHLKPYINRDFDIDDDFDLITYDLIRLVMIDLANINDSLTLTFSENGKLEDYKKVYNSCRLLAIKNYEVAIGISYRNQDKVSIVADDLAQSLGIINTTYYDEFNNLLDKIRQLTKFTNMNALQSIVIRTISGEKYDMDLVTIKEQLYNLYLSYSRLLQKFEKEDKNIEQNILELLIFSTSLSILFNIENKDLCQ